MTAVKRGDTQSVSTLISDGTTDVNAATHDGTTALTLAVRNIRQLVKAGATIDTAFMEAVEKRNLPVVRILLSLASVRPETGLQALQLAVEHDSEHVVRELLHHRAVSQDQAAHVLKKVREEQAAALQAEATSLQRDAGAIVRQAERPVLNESSRAFDAEVNSFLNELDKNHTPRGMVSNVPPKDFLSKYERILGPYAETSRLPALW
jgi:ankyrin repeat protein